MRLDHLTVNLRLRSGWEAIELGMALVRRHARAIWRPWFAVGLPVFVVLNALGVAAGHPVLAGLVMWWLKPVFERIPLFVVSRAVFGEVPTLRQTLAAQWRWGWRPMSAYLTWRRFSPARSLLLPIDLLEGPAATQVSGRRGALAGPAYGHAAMLTAMCASFELVVWLGVFAGAALMVPLDALPDSAQAAWEVVRRDPPAWTTVLLNFVAWMAAGLLEPFYVGAGFGLYLNRRIEIEAWDVELVFRRLRERLDAAARTGFGLAFAGVLGGVLALTLLPHGAQAATPGGADRAPGVPAPAKPAAPPATTPLVPGAGPALLPPSTPTDDDENPDSTGNETAAPAQAAPPAHTLDTVFGEARVSDARFRKAADATYTDPQLDAHRDITHWSFRPFGKEKPQDAPKDEDRSAALRAIGAVVSAITQYGLWVLVGLLLLTLLLTARYWLPWMRGGDGRRAARHSPLLDLHDEVPDLTAPLPPDVPGAARQLWADGFVRRALALLYRAGVASMAARLALELPPGATEAYCLRTSRTLPDPAERALFANLVRTWQYAAYGGRWPDDVEFEGLVAGLAAGGWLRS